VIVLDENLLVLRLDNPIAAWYPGRVCCITDLQPGAIIKDEAIPQLLQRFKGVTFVTTNVTDFWKKIQVHVRYSIICLSLPNEKLRDVPELLKRLFRMSEFKTKADRMGKVIRAGRSQIQYYTASKTQVITLTWVK
jgi:hypothetical protein